jgi:hypothetical protein
MISKRKLNEIGDEANTDESKKQKLCDVDPLVKTTSKDAQSESVDLTGSDAKAKSYFSLTEVNGIDKHKWNGSQLAISLKGIPRIARILSSI